VSGSSYVSFLVDPALLSLIQQNNALVVQNIELVKALMNRLNQPIQAAISYDQVTDADIRVKDIESSVGIN
jgi:hypothetical protein